MQFLIAAAITFVACFIVVPILIGLFKMLIGFTIVQERQCHVYMLFGKVIGIIDEPGFYFLFPRMGWRAFLVHWIGKCLVVDMRIDQEYLRSQPVNSEEGAPIGIGIWYEMMISDPVSYLFKNTDPRGSLAANVSNSTVRSLSNMPLDKLMCDRHGMSKTVREEVSQKSHEWGYKLGSVYIRKVHFRDAGMIRQIESKVVNRLRQVTSAIKQDGANQVSIITSTADRKAAVEFAKAKAIRPQIVGNALNKISQDKEVASTMFDILEMQKLIDGEARISIIPKNHGMLSSLLASDSDKPHAAKAAPRPPSIPTNS
ncbi:MAG: stomatin/prohibitin-family rane protease subunit YbbK [Verrucomicrobia bacterium]|jgi:regulator of protease activity HflC (stomatin/prohibitin superfamily)|nr:stomatin/prohibitin-family rane protease subunit YbbK [Verrucomicrobiota bacterium]